MKWLDKIFKKNDSLENIKNNTVKSFTSDDVEYYVNLSELSCTCKDWALERFIYNKDDPRRLCKHLIEKIDLNTLSEDLKYFREKIEHHKKYETGFTKYIDDIRYIKEADCKVLYRNRSEWNSVCDSFGITYGLSITSHGYRWTNRGKPKEYKRIEDIFGGSSADNESILIENDSFLEAIDLFEDEKVSIMKLIESNGYKNISFEFATDYEIEAGTQMYRLRYFDEKGEEYIDDYVDITNTSYSFSSMFSDGFTSGEIFSRNEVKIKKAKIKRQIERTNRINEERKLTDKIKEQNKIYSSTYKINDLLKKYNIKYIIGKDLLKIINIKYVKNNIIVVSDIKKYCVNIYENIRFYDEYFVEFLDILENDIKMFNLNKKEDIKIKKLAKKQKENRLIARGIPKEIKSIKKYLTTKEILELCDTPFDIIKFNTILKQLNLITKIEYKPNIFSNYILIHDGLKYGDNISEINSFSYIDFINIKPFVWVEFNTELNKYITRDDFIMHNEIMCIPSCSIFWKVDLFLELYQKVCDVYIDELNIKKITKLNSKKIVRPKTQKELERESWLKDIECPGCKSKNIHKKDKRQRKDYQVQRYQCRDCNKIFQEKINDE